MKNISFMSIFLLTFVFSGYSQQFGEITPYEASGMKETPRYEETINYCKSLAAYSHQLHYTTFGSSSQGRPLPLLILNQEGIIDPASVKASGDLVVLIQACIHPGESDGKDATLMLLRDALMSRGASPFMGNMTVLFIPIFNVDGHERFGPYNRINQNGPEEMGWRVTAQNYNLNRDFLKADAPEMQAWLKLFNAWLPDFFIDIHTTDGADYEYVLTYDMESVNMYPPIATWQDSVYIPEMTAKMNQKNMPVFQYISFRNWFDPRSGMKGGVAPPMISQGYTALQNRPGLLVETHMLKDYQTRVSATYELLKITLALLAEEADRLKKLVRKADVYTSSATSRNDSVALNYRLSMNDSVMMEFKGFEYSIEKSDLSGGNWFKFSDKPKTFLLPFFDNSIPTKKVQWPEAYIIPAEWTDVIARLDYHGISYQRIPQATRLKVETYFFTDYSWSRAPYEGHFRLKFEAEPIVKEVDYPAGSVVVNTKQRNANVIAYLLEPEADGSLLSWGFFNSIFEQKEYAESYVMEKMAREMLKNDPDLKKEFQQKKKEDEEFAGNFWAILNWFYSKTPYWDERKDVYPVGRMLYPLQ